MLPDALSDRWSSLHEACTSGSIEKARELVESGADINLRTKDGSTPYSLALAASKTDICRYLMGLAGFDPAQRFTDSRNLSYCAGYREDRFLKFPGASEAMRKAGGGQSPHSAAGERMLYLHADFRVRLSVFPDLPALFGNEDPAWIAFCAHELEFRVPDDFELAGDVK